MPLETFSKISGYGGADCRGKENHRPQKTSCVIESFIELALFLGFDMF